MISRKLLPVLAAIGMFAGGVANAAPVQYVLDRVEWSFGILPNAVFIINNGATPPPPYTNQLVGTCDGCGIAKAIDDGFGNITLKHGSLPQYGDPLGNGLFSVCNSTVPGTCPITATGGNTAIFSFGGNGTTTLTPGGVAGWTAGGVNALIWNQAFCIDSGGSTCGTGGISAFGGPNAPGGNINWSNGVRGDTGAARPVVQNGAPTTPGPYPWQQGNNNGVAGNIQCCALAVWVENGELKIMRQVSLLANPPSFANYFQAYTLTYTIVPVPAAVWLFGSALGLMAMVRRKLNS